MKKLAALIAALAFTSHASASVLTEDFSNVPGWQSNWFGTQSNTKNYYEVKGLGSASERGNNPDGLWLDDNDGVNEDKDLTVVFNDVFAASLSTLSLDLASYINMDIKFFDALGNSLSNQTVTPTLGATTLPGTYQNFTVSSATGIGGFSLFNSSDYIEGNVSLDNLVAVINDSTPSVSVPEPASLLLLGLGALGLVAQRRKLI
ncbi:MAG TPA: PEP-CTERM sorting domain-containing protein [Cellvibrionaceae bacterium]